MKNYKIVSYTNRSEVYIDDQYCFAAEDGNEAMVTLISMFWKTHFIHPPRLLWSCWRDQ